MKKRVRQMKLKKQININLNKLSPNNSKKIFQKILELSIKKKDIFDYNNFVDTLFDKAVMQPIYCPLYVKLLMVLLNESEPEKNVENDIEEDIEVRKDSLSLLVRDKCDLFMNMITEFKDIDDAILNPDDYDDFCEKNKEKVYKKGFSQFIGELYKSRFVDSNFIKKYINALCDNIMNSLNENNTNVENASICLCQLVQTTINRRLFRNNESFKRIREIKDHSNIPKKLKFKFMDLLGD